MWTAMLLVFRNGALVGNRWQMKEETDDHGKEATNCLLAGIASA